MQKVTSMRLSYILALPLALLCSSCSNFLFVDTPHIEFSDKKIYPKTYDIYKNEELLANKDLKATHIVVDKTTQRLKLYIGKAIAVDTPCTTGKSGKRTPSGEFAITSKIKNKRSTIFGRCYYRGRCVHGGDKRKCRSRYNKFVGSNLPYWMRLTDNGIGMHASHGIRRYAGSNGCIRLPYSIASTIYSRTDNGTSVTIK